MGNRAVIAFVDDKGECDVNSAGIYLHWNGGRDSVEGFLAAAKDYGIRSGSYGLARLTQIICNCFPGTISVGVDVVKKLDCDNYDNGVYWVDKNFNIVGFTIVEKLCRSWTRDKTIFSNPTIPAIVIKEIFSICD